MRLNPFACKPNANSCSVNFISFSEVPHHANVPEAESTKRRGDPEDIYTLSIGEDEYRECNEVENKRDEVIYSYQ
jgi:hypothetical protein